jgi:hypothetical protein
MSRINWGRVILGGLLAGVILNVWDFVVNGVLLKSDWNQAMQALGKAEMGTSTMIWFVLYDFLVGIFLVWLYAAIRPRYGAGAKTAACAGLALWLLVGVFRFIGEGPVGLFPMRLYLMATLAALPGILVAALAGGRTYQEM